MTSLFDQVFYHTPHSHKHQIIFSSDVMIKYSEVYNFQNVKISLTFYLRAPFPVEGCMLVILLYDNMAHIQANKRQLLIVKASNDQV